jgi:NAD(P)-dependent dehydrogenase (short-subunit alcohol dehydrogenase family)
MPNALITGGSAGLGRALALALAHRGWGLVLDGRRPHALSRVAEELAGGDTVLTVPGDVADPDHRNELLTAAQRLGGLDLLVNNASTLGPTPLRAVNEVSSTDLSTVFQVNVVAPLSIIAATLPVLRPGASVINISSDAAVEHYPHWGGYGASKAALDHLTATMAVEQPTIRWYSVDPGDMNTDMQRAASPGEDLSDRRRPQDVVPALLDLVDRRPPSGRYLAGDGVALPDRARPDQDPR